MLWRLDRTKDGPQLQPVDPMTLAFDASRRRVVLYPGAGVWNRSQPQTLAGSIKYVEQTLASTLARGEPPVDIFLYSYDMPYEDYGAKREHYAQGRGLTHLGMSASRFTVLPLLLGMKEKLGDLTPAQLKERLSTLTLFGHSYGTIMTQDIVNNLAAQLHACGWQDAVIADTLKELVTIGVAPIARQDFPAPNATQFFFNSVNDMTAVDSIRHQVPRAEEYLPMLRACGYGRIADILERHGGQLPRPQLLEELARDVDKTRHGDGVPKPLLRPTASGYLISSMLPDHEVRWIERRADGSEICRVLDAAEAERTQTAVVHDYRTYLHGDHKLGDVLINVANNAVQRAPGIGDGHPLLMNTEQTREQHAHKRAASERATDISERGLA